MKTVVLVALYVPGISSRGDDDVVPHLLAPAYLKSAVMADSDIKRYNIKILDMSTYLPVETIIKNILAHSPSI
jgi:hypothetical protein